MCVAYIALQSLPGYQLVIAHNRDEFFNRSASTACFWPEAPDLLAGRDAEYGGTWLGVTRAGRLGVITNVRKGLAKESTKQGRGLLVPRFLRDARQSEEYARDICDKRPIYRPFNLVVGNCDELFFVSSETDNTAALPYGFHGLSNGLLNDPWPKVQKGLELLERFTKGNRYESSIISELLALLSETAVAPDDLLPDTGVGLEIERLLSPVFVSIPSLGYGTRTSTVLLVRDDATVTFVERTYDIDANHADVSHTFSIEE